jgi:tetratricopeptide (TPR) repeat protein
MRFGSAFLPCFVAATITAATPAHAEPRERRQPSPAIAERVGIDAAATRKLDREIETCEQAPRFADDCLDLIQLGAAANIAEDPLAAEAYQRRALALRIAAFGADSDAAAQGHAALGSMLLQRQRHAEAEVEVARAVALFRKLGGPDWALSRALLDLAGAIQAQGRIREAEPLLREALGRMPDREGSRYSRAALALRPLADNLTRQGRHAEAEQVLRRLLAATRVPEREDSGIAKRALMDLAWNLAEQRRTAEGEAMMREALGNPPPALDRSPTVYIGRAALGRYLLRKSGDTDGALTELRRVTRAIVAREMVRETAGLLPLYQTTLRLHVEAAWRVAHRRR